jgi:hypothetical protein
MQNKQSVVGLIAAAVIITGAGFVYLYDKAKPAPEPNRTVAEKITPAKSSVAGTIADVLNTKENKQCNFETSDNASGKFYLANDKVYGTLTASESGQNDVTYVIKDHDNFYIWGGSLPSGIRISMSLSDLSKNLNNNPYASSFDVNQKVEYSCKSWTPDESVFTPPTDIKFTDINATSLPTGTAQPKSVNPTDQCSLCNSLSGQAKNTCIASFHCQ